MSIKKALEHECLLVIEKCSFICSVCCWLIPCHAHLWNSALFMMVCAQETHCYIWRALFLFNEHNIGSCSVVVVSGARPLFARITISGPALREKRSGKRGYEQC